MHIAIITHRRDVIRVPLLTDSNVDMRVEDVINHFDDVFGKDEEERFLDEEAENIINSITFESLQ